MTRRRIGVLHPGQMGRVVAATLKNSGHDVYWASEGRSERTRDRAEETRLSDAGSLASLCDTCPVIVSVCPPEVAERLADSVLECGFRGLYVEANAVSPELVQRIGRKMQEAGVSFVDGGIIGPATLSPGRTWLYLSGRHADEAASCFSAGPISAEPIGEEIGKASALKICFAANNKGKLILQCATAAAAQRLGVWDELQRQWMRNGASPHEIENVFHIVAQRAWRWGPEMREIADAFETAGQPRGFHEAAAAICQELVGFKDADHPSPTSVIDALAGAQSRHQER